MLSLKHYWIFGKLNPNMSAVKPILKGDLSFFNAFENLLENLIIRKLFRRDEQNATIALKVLIKKLNIKVTSETADSCLSNHPEYPSLLALSDCLNSWNVPHESYKIDKANFNIDELSYPFIAHLPEKSGKFILIESIVNDVVRYSGETGLNKVLTKEDFLDRWSGIVLYAQKTQESGEPGYAQAMIGSFLNLAKLPFLFILSMSALIMVLDNNNISSSSYLSILAIKFAGVVVSIILIAHSINAGNPFLQNLCSIGGKSDCNAILKSEAAKIASWLSWSEVGMFYFIGSFLCLLFNPSSTILLKYLNISCLPYTIYSISYQFKMGKWCILCCAVQILLWTEGLIFILNYPFANLHIPSNEIFSVAFWLLFPVAIWGMLKPLLIKSDQTQLLKGQVKMFKYNSDLFNQLLTNQHRYLVPDDIKPITMGNREASTVITMVSNPFCGPCAKAHRTINEWLQNRDDLQLKIVFSTGDTDDDPRTMVARHLSALSTFKDSASLEDALSDWYFNSNGNYDSWAKKHPISYNGEMNFVTGRQKRWCKAAEITFTPTIFINGYKLPEPYNLEDIEYLIV